MKSVGALATSIYDHTPNVVNVFTIKLVKKKVKGALMVMSEPKSKCQRL